jgi:hypothetical protein
MRTYCLHCTIRLDFYCLSESLTAKLADQSTAHLDIGAAVDAVANAYGYQSVSSIF